jgi:PAS domain S-box-containing protein
MTARGARYDLLLLTALADMTGLDLMDYWRRLPSMTVIVVSADDVIDSAIGALRRGAYDFVRKPYQPEELLRTVDNALQRKHLERTNALISARLERSERLHRYLVDHSPDIIYMVDEQGRFNYLNPTVAAMLGYERGELTGHHYADVVHEEDVERARFAFGERRTGERASRNVELRLKRKGSAGEAPLTVALSATGATRTSPVRAAGASSAPTGGARHLRAQRRGCISFQAYHDQLTLLPNRILFLDRLSVAWYRPAATAGWSGSVHRPRPLQAGQRHLACRGRPAVEGGGRAVAGVSAPQRYAGAHGRRRVHHSAPRADPAGGRHDHRGEGDRGAAPSVEHRRARDPRHRQHRRGALPPMARTRDADQARRHRHVPREGGGQNYSFFSTK